METFEARAYYLQVLEAIERQTAPLKLQYQTQMACQKGCSACCRDNFKIRPVEQAYMAEGLALQSHSVQLQVAQRLAMTSEERNGECPYLLEQACSVYDYRPVLCRAFGLMLLMNETVSTCPLNFTDVDNTSGTLSVVDMQPFFELLDTLSE